MKNNYSYSELCILCNKEFEHNNIYRQYICFECKNKLKKLEDDLNKRSYIDMIRLNKS